MGRTGGLEWPLCLIELSEMWKMKRTNNILLEQSIKNLNLNLERRACFRFDIFHSDIVKKYKYYIGWIDVDIVVVMRCVARAPISVPSLTRSPIRLSQKKRNKNHVAEKVVYNYTNENNNFDFTTQSSLSRWLL